MSAVCDLLFKHQFHKLLCGRAHILKSLSEWNNGKSHIFEVLNHLHSTPAVKSDLTDIKTITEPFNEFFDIAVMHHIALCGLQKPLPFPDIIRHMVTADTQLKGVFGYPEIRQDHIFVILIKRRKYQDKSRDISSGREVKTAVTYTPLQVIFPDWERTSVPFVHRHPADSLFHPLVQP